MKKQKIVVSGIIFLLVFVQWTCQLTFAKEGGMGNAGIKNRQSRSGEFVKSVVTPINAAEAIIEVFWDPEISGLKNWEIVDGQSYGLNVSQNWCWVTAEWALKPDTGPALSMSKSCEVDCSDYDKLIISAVIPYKGTLRIIADTDKGRLENEFVRQSEKTRFKEKKEYIFDLEGSEYLKTLTIEFDAVNKGFDAIYLNWIGLQNSNLLSNVIKQYSSFSEHWVGLLKPESFEPKYEPTYGFLINARELEELRVVHKKMIEESGQTNFTKVAERSKSISPEAMINRFANNNDSRYCRDRDLPRQFTPTGVNVALAGLIMKDKELMRLGARYALSIAACEYWDSGFICYYPLGVFEQRPFVQSLSAHDVALLLDLVGEMFTDAGQKFIRRKLGEHALGSINFNYWKWDYIYKCNQAAWFSPARLLSYLVLEQSWPRIKPYTELAYNDLVENINSTILIDGGYPEGSTYFRCIGRDAGLAFYYYARARGKEFEEVVPQRMKLTDNFAESIYSTVEERCFINVCDSSGQLDTLSRVIMATICPDGAWARILKETLKRSDGNISSWPLKKKCNFSSYFSPLSDMVLAWKLTEQTNATNSISTPKPFIFLPETGYMASTRLLDNQIVKLFIMGGKSGIGHNHEDKGSFVLELAGEIFAADPGIGSYSDPVGMLVSHCQSHNMLVPVDTGKRPAPENPLPADMKPEGRGDETSFYASIDATAGWQEYYRKWIRTWESPNPQTLIIKDEYELVKGDAVEFYWQTEQDVKVVGQIVTISGKHAQVVLEVPEDCSVHVEPSIIGKNKNRIVIRKEETSGLLEVKAKLLVYKTDS